MILEYNWNYSSISYKSSIFYNIVLLFYSRLKKLGDICHNDINFEGLTPETDNKVCSLALFIHRLNLAYLSELG